MIKTNLETLIKDKNITLQDLSNHLNLTQEQLKQYVDGKSEMSLKILIETCSFLQCSPKDIYPDIIIYDKGIEIPNESKGFFG
ncbi:MAG: helix-turn-helix domain-containing protein, partial [Alphaproteobacteria bacterium]|nr:helix-turn-helix domain-containing protein [Alphaproteobacteria bacterium]